MNPLVFMGLFFILIGVYRLSAPDFIWGQTVRHLRRQGILVSGRTPEWERKQRHSAILFIIMGIIFLTLGIFVLSSGPRMMPPSAIYSPQPDGIFVTATPGFVIPVVNSP